jgi:transposase
MRSSSPARYPSDLTDEQWALIEPMVPVKPGGRPAIHPRRRIVEAILYVTRTGCAWRALPHDFPPWATVYWYAKRWTAEGSTDRIHHALRAAARDAAGRDPLASAGIVDAQAVGGADTVGRDSRGYDAGKKVSGRRRHVVVDTIGLLVAVLVTAASLQDRDGGRLVLARARMKMPSIVLVWADGGHAGRCVAFARRLLRITGAIVTKPEGQTHLRGAAPPLGGGADAVLAGALPAAGPRLRAAPGAGRGDGQVGDDRADGTAAGTRLRTPPLATGQSRMTPFPTRSNRSRS